MNAIEFQNVWKKFQRGEKFNSLRDAIPNLFKKAVPKENLEEKEFWAVKDVNFHVKKGEVVGVIGPNGAGKSTILKLLSRIMKPNRGSMSIVGRLSALIEVTAGFHPELTGRENIYLNGTILGMKRKEIDEKFKEIIEFSGLKEFIDTPVKRYSSGMFSRLGFSVAAHVNPDVLLVDEVLSVGDIAFQSKCAQKMRALLKSGTTIMIVSHNLPLIESLCKRVLLIDNGEKLKEGPPLEVIPYYEDIMFNREEEDIKRKIKNNEYKVKLQAEKIVEIVNVIMSNGKTKNLDQFNVGDPISIMIEYYAKQIITRPIFCLDIVRSDGVLCCSSTTADNNISIEHIEGRGVIKINLGRINLTPGIYIPEIAIVDEELVHPHIIRKSDILRIEANSSRRYTGAVFLPEIDWVINCEKY